MTTLGVGGLAQVVAHIHGEADARQALADAAGQPWCVLGGGSNVIAPDEGIAGWILHPAATALSVVRRDSAHVWVRADAGLPWDDLVAAVVAEGWAGVTCLSGIPGSVGAAPIQNIGAYGQQIADCFASAEVFDCASGTARTWTPADCAFAYRDSALKRAAGQFLVLSVTLRLAIGGQATVRYGELQRHLQVPQGGQLPSLPVVREAVLTIRRKKGMVIDPADPDSRSAGSFFMNPVVPIAAADTALARLQSSADSTLAMPRYGAGDGQCKLSAAWLIDHSGMKPGYRLGDDARVGLSSKHTLALINRGGATAAELLAFAGHIQARVAGATGIDLHREPVLLKSRIPGPKAG